MERTLATRATAITLAVLTLAACVLAWLNWGQESRIQNPTDGVWWVESHYGAQRSLEAQRVPLSSACFHAGLAAGDQLVAVNEQPTPRVASLVREWYRTKVYGTAHYLVMRHGVRLEVPVILDAQDTSLHPGLRFIALVYLGIGLYVLFRRWTAPHATHFYIFCLASFAMYAFLYTGRLNTFDQTIYWLWIIAGALQPALFLHFALSFAHTPPRHRRLEIALTYLPGLIVVSMQVYAVLYWSATGLLAHRLDQAAMAYLDCFYLVAAAVFYAQYRESAHDDAQALRRQQLKWLTRGTLVTVLPFTLFYVLPYLLDWPVPPLARTLSIVVLAVLPLTFSWAIVRYRLMDVDLIFKRGVTYTLATAALVGLYFLLIGLTAEIVHKNLPATGEYGLVGAIIITSALFDPVKRIVQERVDRVFERRRVDYRQTLIEFGRGLSTQTDLPTLLAEITHRLPHTLLLARAAVFLRDESTGRWTLAGAHGLAPEALAQPLTPPFVALPAVGGLVEGSLAEGITNFDGPGAPPHLFLENPRSTPHLPQAMRQAAAALDLHYYIPCRVTQHTIAVIGLGRTTAGDFLSSEDVELLESLAGYIAIALQNARLYRSLESKIAEFERLKEFNESIVESTDVGILAVDLNERIESWNAQMEVLFAIPRADALGQRLEDVFSPSFVREFQRVKDTPGVHHLYKFQLSTRGSGVPASAAARFGLSSNGAALNPSTPVESSTLEPKTANISIAPLVSRDLQTLGRIILVDDISERLALEAQLAQSEKLSSIGLLAAGVAHEVNTPLAVISSYAQMLTKQLRARAGESPEADRLSPLLDKITQQTFRASEIVNSLLNFSRTGAAGFRDTDLNTVIRETLVLLEHQFKTAAIRLDADLESGLPPIQGSPNKLQQVFLNLFLNAKDAMAETRSGTLQIRTRLCYEPECDHITVEVRDTGSGIAPEHLARIYDPFFTTKTAPREGERRGTGLGLSVTYGIVQEHAGAITVESQPGLGTTFFLDFPLKAKPAHA